jgi:L-2,4-diaminobutyric acid acetyltransferase
MWQLVRDCKVLDQNSCYAYLLLCRDFCSTTLVAKEGDALLGFVAAYFPPAQPDTVFVWQIGTAAAARRRGIGKSLLRALLHADACRGVRYLEATVTPSNAASLRLFQAIAKEFETDFQKLPGFASRDFDPRQEDTLQHEPEDLVRIGPLRSKDEDV